MNPLLRPSPFRLTRDELEVRNAELVELVHELTEALRAVNDRAISQCGYADAALQAAEEFRQQEGRQ